MKLAWYCRAKFCYFRVGTSEVVHLRVLLISGWGSRWKACGYTYPAFVVAATSIFTSKLKLLLTISDLAATALPRPSAPASPRSDQDTGLKFGRVALGFIGFSGCIPLSSPQTSKTPNSQTSNCICKQNGFSISEEDRQKPIVSLGHCVKIHACLYTGMCTYTYTNALSVFVCVYIYVHIEI